MEDKLQHIIAKLEQGLRKSQETGSGMHFQYAFSYSFIDPGHTPDKELKTLQDPLSGLEAVLQLLEQYADVDYFYEPDYLCRYFEHYYQKGYEELLLQSVKRCPIAYTLHLLQRVINDRDSLHRTAGIELLRDISRNNNLTEDMRQDAAERVAHIEEQERPLVVHPSNYQVITLDDAINRFDLETLYYRTGGHDRLADYFNEPPLILLFEGDTTIEEDIDIAATQLKLNSNTRLTGLEKLLYQNNVQDGRIIIINGSLKAHNIDMSGIHCLFVFGSLDCEKIDFGEARLAWVKGNLNAAKAILATALSDDDFLLESKGADAACVQGTAYSPRVQTWYMRLSHLNWAPGSGEEFAEDEHLEEHLHKTDPIWNFKTSTT